MVSEGKPANQDYQVEFSEKTRKEIENLPKNVAVRILQGCERLKTNPYLDPKHIKKLKGFKDLYRLRVGDYRIVYKIVAGKVYIVTIISRQDFEKEF